MTEEGNKVLGEKRRCLILTWLKGNNDPMTGKILAERMNVSRQVIVQDVSLLKAKGEPIIATSRGYVYFQENKKNPKVQRVIAVCHLSEETEVELYTLVDHGVSIQNVMVEHPIYGDITGSLMLKNRRDVDAFLDEMKQTKAALLSQLTEGVHLHTIEAETQRQLDEACEALRTKGILLEQ
ncbi:transcription repressor NadR [Virgibacillus litoralis]|uniref:Transcriptional regulator of NAD metabolism n=1 Tax=Virgibacillus litoralis TaxID=578221 RepID=A0ABS4HB91_9BACI|nr:transcription repressor NadR [Virgibacillus litoralis]MBP1948143.1 transcriptional regulator of NAD metabolism [Virgibacillus litoralis]